jgi:uncharacterized membrane protein YgcG/uncharacterized protein
VRHSDRRLGLHHDKRIGVYRGHKPFPNPSLPAPLSRTPIWVMLAISLLASSLAASRPGLADSTGLECRGKVVSNPYCARASTEVERAICHSKIAATAACLLDYVYRDAATVAQKWGAFAVPNLEQERRNWIAQRDTQCGPDESCLLRSIRQNAQAVIAQYGLQAYRTYYLSTGVYSRTDFALNASEETQAPSAARPGNEPNAQSPGQEPAVPQSNGETLAHSNQDDGGQIAEFAGRSLRTITTLGADGYVADLAHVIDEPTRKALESKIGGFRDQTGVQIAIITLSGLLGRSIADWNNDLTRAWAMGQPNEQVSLYLVYAMEEKQIFVEISPRLNTRLPMPDQIAQYVASYGASNISFGLSRAVGRIISILAAPAPEAQQQEVPPEPQQAAAESAPTHESGVSWTFIIILAVVIGIPLALLIRESTSPRVETFETPFLHVTRDRHSGAVQIRIKVGQHKDRQLPELSFEEIILLLEEARQQDAQCAEFLEVYLLKNHGPDWRVRADGILNRGQRSNVDTTFLSMSLDHDTGALGGVVKLGRFKGRRIEELSLDQLRLLHEEIQVDSESVQVLEAYLNRYHGSEWRAQAERDRSQAQKANDESIRRTKAYAVLGLSEGATEDQIKRAFRRRIKKLHPDKGGDDPEWFRQLTEARDILLGEDRGFESA